MVDAEISSLSWLLVQSPYHDLNFVTKLGVAIVPKPSRQLQIVKERIPKQRCGYSNSLFARICCYTAGSRDELEGLGTLDATRKNKETK